MRRRAKAIKRRTAVNCQPVHDWIHFPRYVISMISGQLVVPDSGGIIRSICDGTELGFFVKCSAAGRKPNYSLNNKQTWPFTILISKHGNPTRRWTLSIASLSITILKVVTGAMQTDSGYWNSTKTAEIHQQPFSLPGISSAEWLAQLRYITKRARYPIAIQ